MRQDIVWINVTTNPTAEWVARQITEAFPWDGAPRYMIRDRDQIYENVVTRRLRAMGIRDKPTAPASPWQNGFVERLIGSIRRDVRSLTGKNAPFDRPQPDAGRNERKGFDPSHPLR